MILNLPTNEKEVSAQICIVGAGAAGIILARVLETKGFEVLLLEAGPLDSSKRKSDSLSGQEVGYKINLQGSRLLQFGGTTGHWTGWCTPLDPEDFQENRNINYPGWPIHYETMKSYYERATVDLNLGDVFFKNEKEGPLSKQLQKVGLKPKRYQISSPIARFEEKFKKNISASNRIKLLCEATVTDLFLRENGKELEKVKVQAKTGTFFVRAKHFILACGGIETPRLLLASQSKSGVPIGKGYRFVGKNFMERPHFVRVGRLLVFDHWKELNLFLPPEFTQPKPEKYYFQIQSDIKKKNGWLNSALHLHESEPSGDFEKKLIKFYSDNLGCQNVKIKQLWLNAEQEPNSGGDLTLSKEVDSFGVPRVKIDWKLTDLDWKSSKESLEFYRNSIGRLGFGVIKMNEVFNDGGPPEPVSHHMGLTKMGKDSSEGFVDANLEVFGVHNLSIVGSSVFPTSGFANPTLTVVALAMRLADHLEKVLK